MTVNSPEEAPVCDAPYGLVVAGGRTGKGLLVREASRASVIVAADSGIAALNRAGIVPHVLLGDFDSVDPRTIKKAEQAGVTVLRFPVAKDKTDTEIALDFLLERGLTRAYLVGALGGRRIDHELANIFLMEAYLDRGLRVTIVDPATWATVLKGRKEFPDSLNISAATGDWVSLFPLTETVTGVTLRDLEFPLAAATLLRGSTLPVSNRVLGPRPRVEVGTGTLLVVVTRNRPSSDGPAG